MITEEDYLRGAEKYLKKKYGEEFESLLYLLPWVMTLNDNWNKEDSLSDYGHF